MYLYIYIIHVYASHPSHSNILSESSAPPHMRNTLTYTNVLLLLLDTVSTYIHNYAIHIHSAN